MTQPRKTSKHRRGTASSVVGLITGLRQPLGQNGYLKYLAGLSGYRNRINRHLWFGEASRALCATAQGHAWQAAALLGGHWQAGPGTWLSPEAGLVLNHAQQQEFTESGGYGLRALPRHLTIPSLAGHLAVTHYTQIRRMPLRLDASRRSAMTYANTIFAPMAVLPPPPCARRAAGNSHWRARTGAWRWVPRSPSGPLSWAWPMRENGAETGPRTASRPARAMSSDVLHSPNA